MMYRFCADIKLPNSIKTHWKPQAVLTESYTLMNVYRYHLDTFIAWSTPIILEKKKLKIKCW